MKNRVRYGALFCAVMMTASLAGCGNPAPEAADTEQADVTTELGFVPALDTETECELSVIGGYSNFEALEEQIDKFNAYYPNVSVIYTSLDDYTNNMVTALASDEAPDLFTTKNWMLTNESTAGFLDYAEDLGAPALGLNLDCIRDELLTRDTNGNLTSVPVFANTTGMLVNEDIFKANNLEIPTTLSELEEVSTRLKELGYPSPIASYNAPSGMFEPISMAEVGLAELANPGLAEKISEGGEDAGQLAGPILEKEAEFIEKSGIDLTFCDEEFQDNYDSLIMRFFEGDIPMAIGVADTASGTRKRESQSEAFSAAPFDYSFRPLPISDDGIYMFSQSALSFAVNKNSTNLDMANEFMRYLINTEPLNELAATKNLLSVTNDMNMEGIYAAFADISPDRIVDLNQIVLTDDASNRLRLAAYNIANGKNSLEEMVTDFNTIEV